MARIEATGKVKGELWRVHEADKEILCFMLDNESAWFRIEYDRNILPGRADHMAEMLALAAQEGNGIEVMLEYEAAAGESTPLFRDVKYIQVRAELAPRHLSPRGEEPESQEEKGLGRRRAARG